MTAAPTMARRSNAAPVAAAPLGWARPYRVPLLDRGGSGEVAADMERG